METQETTEFVKNHFPTKKIEVPIDDIQPNKWNSNKMVELMYKKEITSIKNFGFIKPIHVREIDKEIYGKSYEIIDGEHRWEACKELGYTKIVVENLGQFEETKAKALTIILNNLHGEDNVIERAKLLKQLNQGQLGLLPFDTKQIEEELKLLDFDFSQFEDVEIPEEDTNPLSQVLRKFEEALVLLRKLDITSNSKLGLFKIQYESMVESFRKMMKR